MPLIVEDIPGSEHDAADLRFLMEQQLDRIEALVELGRETDRARVVLRRLVERDKVQRIRMLLSETDRFVAA